MTLKELIALTGLPRETVRRHMKQGYCKWPPQSNAGRKKHRLYKTWENMKTRCNNPKATGYHSYGGRGIKVCARWSVSFESFLQDMGEPPQDGRRYTLDRIDVNGDYCPENCRWATYRAQQANTRKGVGYISYCTAKRKFIVWLCEKQLAGFRDRHEAELYLNKSKSDYMKTLTEDFVKHERHR